MNTLKLLAVVMFSLTLAGMTKADHNAAVLQAANSFPDGGKYRADWSKGTGCPVDVTHKNEKILSKDPGGTYCSGFTFATVMKVLHEKGLVDQKSVQEVRGFQQAWYGATAESQERQCVFAVEKLGVGKEVPSEQAAPGDFVQFWRTNKSGHSAVFLGWVEKDGKRTGLKYRSSQGSTNGIGNNEEALEGSGVHIVVDRIYFARIKS